MNYYSVTYYFINELILIKKLQKDLFAAFLFLKIKYFTKLELITIFFTNGFIKAN